MLKSFEELSQGGFNYQEFENVRLEAVAKNKKGLMMGGIIGGVILLIGIIILAVGNAGVGVLFMFLGLITFGIYFAIVNKKAKTQVKEKVLSDMLAAIDPTFSYVNGGREFTPRFKKAGFLKSTSAVHVDDVFKGQINGLEFHLGEIDAKKTQSSGNSTRHITIFKGPFSYIKTANNYGYTSIIPDYMEKNLGGVGKFLQKADITRLNQKNIRIDEDPNFERAFAVWTKDETTTRQILNPEFRSYLLGLSTMAKTYVGWRDEYISFGMDNRKDAFNIKLKNPISEGTVRQFYNDFAEYYNVMENIVSFVTTGVGAQANTSTNTTDVPPPPSNNTTGDNSEYYGPDQNETPPPPPPAGNTPPPPPPPIGGTPPPPPKF